LFAVPFLSRSTRAIISLAKPRSHNQEIDQLGVRVFESRPVSEGGFFVGFVYGLRIIGFLFLWLEIEDFCVFL
jgi:hypothetical protein